MSVLITVVQASATIKRTRTPAQVQREAAQAVRAARSILCRQQRQKAVAFRAEVESKARAAGAKLRRGVWDVSARHQSARPKKPDSEETQTRITIL